MSFDEKYELLAELRNDGIQTFIARDKSNGKALEVHLFLSGRTKDSALLDRLARLSPEHRHFVLDRGVTSGTPYVVSHILPDRRGLREWLGAIPDAPPPIPPPLAGFVKRDTLPPFQAVDPTKGGTLPPFQAPIHSSDLAKGAKLVPAAPQPPSANRSSDEDFLRLFQVPERTNGEPSIPSAPAPPPPAAQLQDLDEFTRIFNTPGTGLTGAASPNVPATPFTFSATQPASSPFGAPPPASATQVFTLPKSNTPAAAAPPTGPSEYTGMFMTAPGPSSPALGDMANVTPPQFGAPKVSAPQLSGLLFNMPQPRQPGALPGMPGGPPQAPANDNKTLFLALGVILVIAIAVVAFFATQQS